MNEIRERNEDEKRNDRSGGVTLRESGVLFICFFRAPLISSPVLLYCQSSLSCLAVEWNITWMECVECEPFAIFIVQGQLLSLVCSS